MSPSISTGACVCLSYLRQHRRLLNILQVESIIKKHKDQLLKERYHFNMGLLMGMTSHILATIKGRVVNSGKLASVCSSL